MLDGRRLLSTKEVQAYTGYSRWTIYRAIESGALRCGRHTERKGVAMKFRLADIDAWLHLTP